MKLILSAVFAATAMLVVPGAPAAIAAGDLTVVVTPATDLSLEGETLEVAVTGTTDGLAPAVVICPTNTSFGDGVDLFDVFNVCRLTGIPGPAAPFTVSVNVSAALDPGCLIDQCSVFAVSPSSDLLSIAAVGGAAFSFEDAPPLPPSYPGLAFDDLSIVEQGDNLAINTSLINRNPATTDGSFFICPSDHAPDDPQSECGLIGTTTGILPGRLLSRLVGPFPVQSLNCLVESCSLVYRGTGTLGAPANDFVSTPLPLFPLPDPIISIAGNADAVDGGFINVVWQSFAAVGTPPEDSLANYVGICVADATAPYSDLDCQGADQGAETFQEADLRVQRFITTERLGVVDCATHEAGCVIGYDLSATDAVTGVRESLDSDERPLTFRSLFEINGGASTSPANSTVAVSGLGLATGAAGFALLCAVGDTGGFDLRCSPDIGTLETPFDGAFDGGIELRPSITVGDDVFDCTTGRGCIVVFAVIDTDLSLIFGGGRWVRAT